jgi:hypothetical protein
VRPGFDQAPTIDVGRERSILLTAFVVMSHVMSNKNT